MPYIVEKSVKMSRTYHFIDGQFVENTDAVNKLSYFVVLVTVFRELHIDRYVYWNEQGWEWDLFRKDLLH